MKSLNNSIDLPSGRAHSTEFLEPCNDNRADFEGNNLMREYVGLD